MQGLQALAFSSAPALTSIIPIRTSFGQADEGCGSALHLDYMWHQQRLVHVSFGVDWCCGIYAGTSMGGKGVVGIVVRPPMQFATATHSP